MPYQTSLLSQKCNLRMVFRLFLFCCQAAKVRLDRKSTRLNSSHSQISYAVFCLKKKKKKYSVILTINEGPAAKVTHRTSHSDSNTNSPSSRTRQLPSVYPMQNKLDTH